MNQHGERIFETNLVCCRCYNAPTHFRNLLHKISLACRERGILKIRSPYGPCSCYPYFSLPTPHREGFPLPLPGDALCSFEFESWELHHYPDFAWKYVLFLIEKKICILPQTTS